MTSIEITSSDKEPLIEEQTDKPSTTWLKVSSALFYGVSSFMITVVNKSVLTSYSFPSFQMLAFGQMLTTVVVLYTSKHLKVVSFSDFESRTFYQLLPLPFIYISNMVFGLGGTKELSLPMFTMLRRFSILMTMFAEFWILGVRPKLPVKISVALMILGAFVAATTDLGFNFQGYLFVLLSDFLTASNGVFTKKILGSNKEIGSKVKIRSIHPSGSNWDVITTKITEEDHFSTNQLIFYDPRIYVFFPGDPHWIYHM